MPIHPIPAPSAGRSGPAPAERVGREGGHQRGRCRCIYRETISCSILYNEKEIVQEMRREATVYHGRKEDTGRSSADGEG